MALLGLANNGTASTSSLTNLSYNAEAILIIIVIFLVVALITILAWLVYEKSVYNQKRLELLKSKLKEKTDEKTAKDN